MVATPGASTSGRHVQQHVEGLLLLDEPGRMQLANRAFKPICSRRGRPRARQDRHGSPARCTNSPSWSSAWTRQAGQVLDHELKLPDMAERWLQVNAAAISNSAGERQGTILVFHDLTRLKQLERTREEFVANVSHELRTPLSLIKGYVETLLDGAKDNPEVATKFLQIIDRNAHRLDLLIQDLLTISALESGRITLNSQPVSLRPLVEQASRT